MHHKSLHIGLNNPETQAKSVFDKFELLPITILVMKL